MTPESWTHTTAILICSKCKQALDDSWSTWQLAEERASLNLNNWPHKCGMRKITTDEAKEAMQLYRAEHPGLSFEEEYRAYNEIMQNQTYL
jgi:hypothetical protein